MSSNVRTVSNSPNKTSPLHLDKLSPSELMIAIELHQKRAQINLAHGQVLVRDLNPDRDNVDAVLKQNYLGDVKYFKTGVSKMKQNIKNINIFND